MQIKYKENPAAWRTSTLLTLLGLALLSSLLRWRHTLAHNTWLTLLVVFAVAAALACIRPQLFRGYYRFSTWAGFWSSLAAARVFLTILFFLVFIPAGIILRLSGKDPLHLKRSHQANTYWSAAKPASPLDRLF